jgi:hypothetical protein
MRILLLGAFGFMSLSLWAATLAPPPEVFQIRVKPELERGVGDTVNRILRPTKAEGSVAQDVALSLTDCQPAQENFYGANCRGSWDKELKIDEVKYHFYLSVEHFENPGFKYRVDVTVCREVAPRDQCRYGSLQLKDANLPYVTEFGGPRVWSNDFGGGDGYDAAVLYVGELNVGPQEFPVNDCPEGDS